MAPLFVIRNGQLFPSSTHFEDFSAVLEHYGSSEALGFYEEGDDDLEEYGGNLPVAGELIVVVADAQQPVFQVPRDIIVYARCEEGGLYLFWAIDEDKGGETVLVAFDNWDVTPRPEDAWIIVGLDAWSQLPMNKELVRAFHSVEEARAAFQLEDCVCLPADPIQDWRVMMVHGYDAGSVVWEHAFRGHPLIDTMLQIPDGWDLTRPFLWGTISGEDFFRETPFPQAENVEVMRAIITQQGGVFIVVKMEDGSSGRKICGKLFTYDQIMEGLAGIDP